VIQPRGGEIMFSRKEIKISAAEILEILESFTIIWVRVGSLTVEPKKNSLKQMLRELNADEMSVLIIETDNTKTLTIMGG
jgi:hypothetical protein